MTTAERDTVTAIKAIETLARGTLLQSNRRLDQAIINSEQNGLPSIEVAPLQGQFLAIQCQLLGAKTVLEIGTLGGYSTIWLAETGTRRCIGCFAKACRGGTQV